MNTKKLLIVSSHKDEAITKWVVENEGLASSIDLLFIEELLKNFDIQDELNDEEALINWQSPFIQYSNSSHYLLNRVIYIAEDLFHSFCEDDREYAQKEFEAYLGFALNAFQSPQTQAINGVCERIKSLPQQWQMVKVLSDIAIPEYYWGSPYYDYFENHPRKVVSGIYDFFNWEINKSQNYTGFSFVKPLGAPLFVLSIGSAHLITSKECQLTKKQHQQVNRILNKVRDLFGYFIFEVLIFITDEKMTFGCINMDISYSAKHPEFNSFMMRHLMKESAKCLH